MTAKAFGLVSLGSFASHLKVFAAKSLWLLARWPRAANLLSSGEAAFAVVVGPSGDAFAFSSKTGSQGMESIAPTSNHMQGRQASMLRPPIILFLVGTQAMKLKIQKIYKLQNSQNISTDRISRLMSNINRE
ncbi:MAG TPA: hypothetical protein VJ698_06090 [Noviherbaspirillum sp.]|uniref:hypothetical protein n=1 Tax=Noviherbaspirillum sp. TaxID=1926288 RepID=UPI002B47F90E|nr:hypothetical protein [Noviherbaspirillum sp.]HJV85026.1 hypothetical protein [Noviherbaspirillum sp.]